VIPSNGISMAWNIRDKTTLITGASAGIGLATAGALAAEGARLVLLCRDRAKGEAARARIRQETGRDVELCVADLASLDQVRRAASEFQATHDRLDVLINYAGAIHTERRLTPDGLEMTFAVNHLAYFLLTELLLVLLKKSAPSRIINVASAAHRSARLDLDDLQSEHGFSGRDVYSRSKLANVMFTYELARRLEGTGVTANCLHPGVIASQFGANARGPVRWFFRFARPFLLDEAKGAATTIFLATSPAVEGVSGKYFARSQEARSSAESHDRTKARRLWELSEAIVTSAPPREIRT
jgi:NAD(P)-dependent dehydrogenase (short-subunit alcohol dehydrogenase family)